MAKSETRQETNTIKNILLLGETGVGKSTWINGIYNYLNFQTMREAQNENVLYLIPTQFSLLDDEGAEIKIQLGTDKNEKCITGHSATQEPRSYLLITPALKINIRLIDTPGMGDTRGFEYDKRNMDSVLKFLGKFDELHCICILLKPNNARLNVWFKFCIKELLTKLHQTASSNIIFCFTNARSTFYKPGDSYFALKKILNECGIEHILNKNTSFYVDNESFRFLCALKHGVSFEQTEIRDLCTSWERSTSETKKLFEYISNLAPHRLADTLELNSMRNNIMLLIKPLADISLNIATNLAVVGQKREEVKLMTEEEINLKKKLVVPMIKLECSPLDYPTTVCTGPNCIKTHHLPGNIIENEYITRCHEPCELKEVVTETYPDERLKYCIAMNPDSGNCNSCNCKWNVHMHITYKQVRQKSEYLDKAVENLLNTNVNKREAIETCIKVLNERMNEFRREQTVITHTSAKFARFLKEYVLVFYNDALGEYLHHLITEEEQKIAMGGNRTSLDHLQDMLRQYEEEVKILNNSTKPIPEEDMNIQESINKLFELTHNGRSIREAYEAQKQSQDHWDAENEVTAHCFMRRQNSTRPCITTRATWAAHESAKSTRVNLTNLFEK